MGAACHVPGPGSVTVRSDHPTGGRRPGRAGGPARRPRSPSDRTVGPPFEVPTGRLILNSTAARAERHAPRKVRSMEQLQVDGGGTRVTGSDGGVVERGRKEEDEEGLVDSRWGGEGQDQRGKKMRWSRHVQIKISFVYLIWLVIFSCR